MMKMKQLITALACFLMTTNLGLAQEISYEKDLHDFGVVKESEGKVAHQFVFTNTGDEALKIERVNASCGCTTPNWTKDPIKPGEQGYIIANFDPKGQREGYFQKHIYVYTNTSPSMNPITIEGRIKKSTTNKNEFPKSSGNVRMSTYNVFFDTVNASVVDSATFEIYNSHDRPIRINQIESKNFVYAGRLPKVLTGNGTTEFKVYFSAPISLNKEEKYGMVYDEIKMITDDPKQPEKTMNVAAFIKPDIQKEEGQSMANAPNIQFEGKAHDFGEVKEGDKLTTRFKFKNTGQQKLEILDISSFCGCTVSSPENTMVEPGDSSTIKVTYDTRKRSGNQINDITVFTNDPNQTVVNLTVRAIVEEQGKIKAPQAK